MEFVSYKEETVKALIKDFLESCDKHLGKPSPEKLKASQDSMCAIEALSRTQKIIVHILKKNHGLELKLITESEAKRIGKLS
jgi:hypothetical protein